MHVRKDDLMITIILSFAKELLNTSKNKFHIAHKDTLAAITLFFIILLGEIMTPIVLGITITYAMLLRILGVALAGMIASLLSSKVVNKLLEKHREDRPYQFNIKFKDITTCEFVELQLKDQGIKTYINKNNKTLKAFSLNKGESRIIKDTIEDRFKNYTVNEFKEYIKSLEKE